jgi:hypothetical protein
MEQMDGTDRPKVFCVGTPHAPATRDEIHRADQLKYSLCMYTSMVEDLEVYVFCLTVSNAQLHSGVAYLQARPWPWLDGQSTKQYGQTKS